MYTYDGFLQSLIIHPFIIDSHPLCIFHPRQKVATREASTVYTLTLFYLHLFLYIHNYILLLINEYICMYILYPWIREK